MSLETIVKIAQIFAYIVAGISFLVAFFTYRNNNKIKRGEWLKSLFEKFYEGDMFSKIRKEIDYGRLESYLNLNVNNEPLNEGNEEELVNYLNFFEFIATLIKEGHLEKDEVKQMFRHYLKEINKNIFLKDYLVKYDFENLSVLLKEYE
jgi:hypothetical protein